MTYVVHESEPVFRADFAELLDNERSLAIQVVGGGTVVSIPRAGFLKLGDRATLTAVADPGWRFAGWSNEASGVLIVGDQLRVTLDASRVVTAHFVIAGAPLAPVLQSSPVAVAVDLGAPTAFEVVAEGSGPLGYVWRHNGLPVSVLATNRLSLAATRLADSGLYDVVVSNAYGSVTSAPPVRLDFRPEVALKAPADGTAYQKPAVLNLTAAASDPDGLVKSVEFFREPGVPLGNGTVSDRGNWVLAWPLPPLGTYGVWAVATDEYGVARVSATNRITIQDLPPPTTTLFSLSVDAATLSEGGEVMIRVRRTHRLDAMVQVRVRTVETGSAQAFYQRSGDFIPILDTEGLLTFTPDGPDEQTRKVVIVDDFLEEGAETFDVTLTAVSPTAVIGAPGRLTVTIQPSDAGAYSASQPNVVRSAPTAERGSAQIQIYGPDGTAIPAGARWRFPWDPAWRTHNEVVADLPEGTYPLEWRPLLGYAEPKNRTVTVVSGTSLALSAEYRLLALPVSRLRVTLNPSRGTAWRLAGEADKPWRTHNEAIDVRAGLHLVEFSTNNAYEPPTPLLVEVPLLGEVTAHRSYQLVMPGPNVSVVPLYLPNFRDITNAQGGGAFNGQVWTSFGWGSAFAVSERVILTAAHMVFGPAGTTNRESPFLWWFAQRHGDRLATRPLRAAGWFYPDTYRIARNANSEEQRRYDFVAVYFDEPVVPQGWGGYLVSSSSGGTDHLRSQLSQVALLGYPMHGTQYGLDHEVHDHFLHSRLLENPSDSLFTDWTSYELKLTDSLRSLPGNSGGPVEVAPLGAPPGRRPAGIYLGELNGQSLVRAITTNVVEQILLAKTAATFGTNHCDGGCASFPVPGLAGAVRLAFNLEPAGIFTAHQGVAVSVGTNSAVIPVQQFDELFAVGFEYAVRFPEIPGFKPLSPMEVDPVAADVSREVSLRYQPVGFPVLVFDQTSGQINLEVRGVPNATVRLEQAASFKGPWALLKTIALDQDGLAAPTDRSATVPVDASGRFFRATTTQ